MMDGAGWRVECGDCLDVMRGMPDSCVDLIATDPPYFKVKGEAWDRQWDKPGQFLAWLDEIAAEWSRILKPNGSLYCFASPRMSARVECLIGERFNVLNRVTWSKAGECGMLGAGRHRGADKDTLRSFFPVTESIIFAEHFGDHGMASFLRASRLAAGMTFSDAGRALGCDGRLVDKWETQRGERDACEPSLAQFDAAMLAYGTRAEFSDWCRPFQVTPDVPYTDVWTFPTVGFYKGKHPCEKPLAMMEHIVNASSRPGGVVLDCFCGSGTTGVAAIRNGREFIGIDMCEKWCGYAADRIAEQSALFADAYESQAA